MLVLNKIGWLSRHFYGNSCSLCLQYVILVLTLILGCTLVPIAPVPDPYVLLQFEKTSRRLRHYPIDCGSIDRGGGENYHTLTFSK